MIIIEYFTRTLMTDYDAVMIKMTSLVIMLVLMVMMMLITIRGKLKRTIINNDDL